MDQVQKRQTTRFMPAYQIPTWKDLEGPSIQVFGVSRLTKTFEPDASPGLIMTYQITTPFTHSAGRMIDKNSNTLSLCEK